MRFFIYIYLHICKICSTFARQMGKILRYIGIVALLVAMAACSENSSEKALEAKQHVAEQRTAQLCEALLRNSSLDTIRAIAEKDEDVLFYVFDSQHMVYWSSNRLASDAIYLKSYDTWRDQAFTNAKTKVRWTKAGMYNVLTVIPVSYTELEDYTEINAIAAQTFSFRQVLESDNTRYAHSRLPFILCHVLFGLILLIGIIGLIVNHGIRNMRLSTRIMYIILTPVLAVFIYIFFMSISYVHRNFEQHQRHDLLMRSEYIQSYLRSLYYWDVALTDAQAQGLSIDLHDLGYDMNQDIHVYSLSGEILASSSPALFSSGILSRRMAPEAIFSEEHTAVCYEQLASHPYLVSYIPFHNGSFVTIGYIAVPYFMSEQTRNAEVDALLARLLPPYIVVLLLALFFSFLAARSMIAPISMLTDKMRHFTMGAKNNHIDYPYHDELGALVERYNVLVDRVEESAEQLAKAEREGAWRTMARQIAHEINNPLTPMKLSVQKLQRLRGTEQFDAYFEKATAMLVSEIDNLANM